MATTHQIQRFSQAINYKLSRINIIIVVVANTKRDEGDKT
jgi:hypothetical protein